MINKVGAKNLNGKPSDFIGKSIFRILPDLADEQKKRFDIILKTRNGITFEDKILLNEKNIVVIDTSLEENLEEGIQDVILSETMVKIKISVGTIVNDILDIKNSYDRAMKAMVLGKRLIRNKDIFYYDQMILPIIINGVKSKKLATLSMELFQGIDSIFEDRELMQTATNFLENNLNISETSKKLFIHRNTLTYRLNKIKKLTSYDLRSFEDAVNFKIALYIHSYNKN